VLGHRNIALAAGTMLCWITCLVSISAFLPNYLLDHLRLDFASMSKVMSAIGLGSMMGSLMLPFLSDIIGRKAVMLLSAACSFLCLLALQGSGAQVGALFGILFAVHFFNNALITMTVGPLCAESVPPALMATASGLVVAVGEIFGGGIAPMIVGKVASVLGIQAILWPPVAMTGIGFFLCLFLAEPEHAEQGAALPVPDPS